MVLVFVLPLFLSGVMTDEVCSNQPADIGFLIDESKSVGDNLAFIKNFVDDFEIGNSAVKISAFAFAYLTGNGFHFNCCFDKTSIKSNIDNINYSYNYGQDFEMAMAFARNSIFQTVNGASVFSLKILMFFTDGRSNSLQDGGSLLHQLGVIVYAVGVGSTVDRTQLNRIATNQSYVFMVSSYADLVGQVYSDIKSKTCTDVLSNPCERNPQPCLNQDTCVWNGGANYTCLCSNGYTDYNCKTEVSACDRIVCYNGGTCIDRLTYFTCKCSEHFTGNLCETVCKKSEEADVLFAVDTSTGWKHSDLTITVPSIINKILTNSRIQLGLTNTQIALLTYASSSNLQFDFHQYNDECERINLRRRMSSYFQSSDLSTNMTAMIENANTLLSDGSKGARLSAKKILVVFSNYKNDLSFEDRSIIENFKSQVEIFVIGLAHSKERLNGMSDIASSSLNIGIDGWIPVKSIDTFIPSLIEQFNNVYCDLP